MLRFKRTKKRNYHNPREKYILSAVAGAFLMMILLTVIGFAGKNALRTQLNETQDMLASSIQSDVNQAMNCYEIISRKNADLSGDALPDMRGHMYAAYEMNRVLTETFGEDYSMLSSEQYASFEAAMDQFDQLLSAGQSAAPAKESLSACMENIRISLANRFTAEGNLLPQTASATTSRQP